MQLGIPKIDMSISRACIVRGMTKAPDGKMMFIKKKGRDGMYIQLPGGGSEPEDAGDIRKTFQRELHQETGVWIKDLERIVLFFERVKDGCPWFCMYVDLAPGEIDFYKPQGPEGDVFIAYPIDVVAGGVELDISNNQAEILFNYLKNLKI